MASGTASVNASVELSDAIDRRIAEHASRANAILSIRISPSSLREVPLRESAFSRAGEMNFLFSFLLAILFEHHCLSLRPRSRSWHAAGRLPARDVAPAPGC
ncbi:MAG TPA: hypothetical protein VN289_06960 [Paraburkholderia sp.]|nr:hypothetical protein [Paraburkholderia sp.]